LKIAIFGAGAVGGYLGARLSLAGEDVTLVARGANLLRLSVSEPSLDDIYARYFADLARAA